MVFVLQYGNLPYQLPIPLPLAHVLCFTIISIAIIINVSGICSLKEGALLGEAVTSGAIYQEEFHEVLDVGVCRFMGVFVLLYALDYRFSFRHMRKVIE